jgi:hypothetical protein
MFSNLGRTLAPYQPFPDFMRADNESLSIVRSSHMGDSQTNHETTNMFSSTTPATKYRRKAREPR